MVIPIILSKAITQFALEVLNTLLFTTIFALPGSTLPRFTFKALIPNVFIELPLINKPLKGFAGTVAVKFIALNLAELTKLFKTFILDSALPVILFNAITDSPEVLGLIIFSEIKSASNEKLPDINEPPFRKSINGQVLLLKPEAITLLLLIVHRSLLDVVFVASTKPGIFVGAPEIEIILLLTDILSYPLLSLTIALAVASDDEILLNWNPIILTLSF